MSRQNSLKSKIRNFGDNFVDSVTSPDLEFHIGSVEKVFNNRSDVRAYKGKLQNKIPNNPSGVILIKNVKGLLPSIGSQTIAKPMLRGISDSVAKGDLVIFCTINNQTYYLGPINTTNEITKTPSPFFDLRKKTIEDGRKNQIDGYSINFPTPKFKINKLQKSFISNADYPNEINIGVPGSIAYHEGSFSDVVLDGRFGNSIRIGSRHSNPILNIHNGRYGSFEDLSNGSIISMMSLGSLNDHFILNQDYTLSSDRRIRIEYQDLGEGQYPGYLINYGNDDIAEPREDVFDYNYSSIENVTQNNSVDRDQIIMFSDRITFDARKNDITISSFRNINLGAGRNITITNKGFTVIESQNIYIGKESKNKAQPMVLGDELRIILLEIMTLLKDSRALVQGVPTPMVDATSSPILPRIQSLIDRLQPREIDEETNAPIPGSGGGTRFLSQYHYLEQNVRGQE